MTDDLRRFKVRFKKKVKDLLTSSDGLDSSAADKEETSEQSGIPPAAPHKNDTFSPEAKVLDTSGWDKIWVEAYKKVKEDPKDAIVVTKLELFLGNEDETNDFAIAADDGDSAAAANSMRLKAIQKIAEERLDAFEEGKLSFNVGKRPIVVRETIIKAVDVINALKPIISGAVVAEPTAALAWAGITTALPILEGIFKQDENAATGLTEIAFLMARYQIFHEPDFASDLQSTSHSVASLEVLQRVKDELVSIYAAIYVYEARFILQYATRNKMHRAIRNALNADDWKDLWSDIRSKASRIDEGIRDQLGVKTLEAWKKIQIIEMRTGRIESVQQDILKSVEDIDRRQLYQSLKITGNAFFDSRKISDTEGPCLQGTQQQILKSIQDWAEDPADTMILWLEGMAGTGKTSISRTVASALHEEQAFTVGLDPPHGTFLGASFFFNKVDATRNNTKEFFTSIAWCLSTISPGNGSPIIKAIRDNQGIETKSPQEQFRKLIADPLAWLDKNTFVPLQLLVIVDALDECDDKDAETLLGMLENLHHLGQVRLRLFITSRREGHISRSFRDLPSHLHRTLRLQKIKPSLGRESDIMVYLSERLKDISRRYQVRDGGLNHSDIEKLAEKSDGLFIYAVTACRFLDNSQFSNKEFRDMRLNLILEQDQGPQQEVDGIYLKVLRFPDFDEEPESVRELFYTRISRLIGFAIVLLRPVSVDTLCKLLTKEGANIDYYLDYLHPILNIPDDPEVPIGLIHLSFRDFMLDEKRSQLLPFSVREPDMHRDILDRCLEIMETGLRHNICHLGLPGTFVTGVDSAQVQSYIPPSLQYACLHWISHLVKIDGESLTQSGLKYRGAAQVFLQKRLLFWLEVMAFIREAPSIIPIIGRLESFIHRTEEPELRSLVRDAKLFVRDNIWIIENAPMQIYCSSLLFCPSNSKVRLYYQDQIPNWITTKPKTAESEVSEIYTLHGHRDRIRDVAFSPTEALLASASDDKTTRIWDYVAGSEQYRFHDPGGPVCLSFSIDGLRLASGCSNGTICVRNFKKASEVCFSCHSEVVQVCFSPTASNVLAALCNDCVLRIWDLDHKHQGPVQHAWTPEYRMGFTFSPDGRIIAVCRGCRISLFNVIEAKVVGQFKVANYASVMAFSIDLRILAVRQNDSIDFWDITSSDTYLIQSHEVGFSKYSFLYLPTDEKFKIHQTSSGILELFEPSTGLTIGKFQRQSGGALSHDGALVADISIYHPVIRVFSDHSTPPLHREMESAPGYVELLDDSTALSYDDVKVTKNWNVVDGGMEPFLGLVRTIKRSANGKTFILQLNQGDEFQVWETSPRQSKYTFSKMADVVFVPGSSHLATLSLSGDLQFLNWNTQICGFEPIWGFRLEDVFSARIPCIHYSASTLYLSPNGQEAIVNLDAPSGTPEMTSCQLWNLVNKIKVNAALLDAVTDITFSPANDFYTVEYDYGRQVRLFQVSNGEKVENCDLYGYSSLTFHPVERLFAVWSIYRNSVVIWEGLPWSQKLPLRVSRQWVKNVALSATSKIAVLSSSNEISVSTIEVWDIVTRQKIYSHTIDLSGHLFSFNFSIDEGFLESSRGRIPVPIRHSTDEGSDQQWGDLHNGLPKFLEHRAIRHVNQSAPYVLNSS
ncbi:wd40 repeat [Fusarium longipes]|uniref:Wd40 repeat n=1 Tax=Fusarium longipes TaxID=694270 RepID=A0A395T8I4_9HYPO|nr:wd40 repeat [Fusarium longipes]